MKKDFVSWLAILKALTIAENILGKEQIKPYRVIIQL